MTKLIVRPLDPQAPGSYQERREFFAVMKAFREMRESGDEGAMLQAFERLEAFLLPRLRTDDATPVEAVLRQLSAADYDRLIVGVRGDVPAVGEANSGSSTEPAATSQ